MTANGSGAAKLALIGEARGEFLFLRKMAERMESMLGAGSVLEIEMSADDLTPDELAGTIVPAREPEFAAALRIPDAELSEAVRAAEREFGIDNLRPLWRSDILSWRDGVSDAELARQAIGYLRVYDRLFRDNPGMRVGFAEDGGRLVKRCFRTAARRHGGHLLIAFTIPFPDRIILVEQEDYTTGLADWDSFDPDELIAQARAQRDSVVSSTVQFSRPRDLGLGPERVRNFLRMAYRQFAGTGPARRAYLGTFTRDYGYQRTQLALLDRFADRTMPEGGSVFYPLQYIQDTQMTLRGIPYQDQTWLIEYMAHTLPYGYDLVVKPHPAAPGELSVPGLLRLRRRFPNLRILHPSVHAHEVLRSTSGMVTVNSTTGYEALMFGVPVVALGDSLYRGKGLTHDVDDPSKLPDVIASAVTGPPPDPDAVLRLLAYCLHVSYAVTPSYADPSQENAERFAAALLEAMDLSPAGDPVGDPA